MKTPIFDLCISRTSVQAYMKLKTPDARTKAWHMLQLLEAVG
jgi:hypothetical protein